MNLRPLVEGLRIGSMLAAAFRPTPPPEVVHDVQVVVPDEIKLVIGQAVGLLYAVEACEEWEVPDLVLERARGMRAVVDEHVVIT